MNTVDHQVYAAMVNDMSAHIHHVNVRAGWWTDKNLGDLKAPDIFKYVFGTKMNLVTTELSEATEGYRKNLMDDHIKTRPMVEVEFADAFIRLFDLAGAMNIDLGGAIIDKLAYNVKRLDHTKEAREAPGGKAF